MLHKLNKDTFYLNEKIIKELLAYNFAYFKHLFIYL